MRYRAEHTRSGELVKKSSSFKELHHAQNAAWQFLVDAIKDGDARSINAARPDGGNAGSMVVIDGGADMVQVIDESL